MIAPKQGAIFVGIYYIIYYTSLEYTTYKKITAVLKQFILD